MDLFFVGLDLIQGIVALLFALMTGSVLYHLGWARRLPGLETFSNTFETATPIRCSVIIAGRDEAARIEQTVRHIFDQNGIDLELIVVDDRSRDSSREILTRLIREDSRLKVLHVDQLPDGWLGKCHACHIGASIATGDWILFTDADCWLKPDTIKRALLVAHRDQADHVTLTPGIPGDTLPTQAWHLAFLISLADWFSGVNRDKPGAYLGMGAFNLVKTEVYRACGGYETLKLCVVDDVKLGYLIKRLGKRTRGFIGGDDALCHWGGSILGMIKVMEKNYFAVLDYKIMVGLGVSLFGFIVWGLALLGPFTSLTGNWTEHPGGIAAGFGLLSLTLPASILARRLGWSVWGALLTPFVFPFLFYAILRSTLVTVRQGGVRWRDTFYSLETLRKARLP